MRYDKHFGFQWGGPQSGPWGRKSRFFEAGEVRLAILSLLAERARHGYELMKAIEARSGGTYKVSAGSIYPTLQMLEDEGLIAAEQSEGRKTYHITDEGRRELEREKDAVDEIWRRAAHWEDWAPMMNPEAFAIMGGSLGHLMKATFKTIKHSRADRRVIDRVRTVLERAAEEVEQIGRSFDTV